MDDPPVIVYHAGTSSFARIFKETSLKETKNAVIKKLGLPPHTGITLARKHGDINLALDDDDDFAAFSVFARSARNVEIQVTVNSGGSVGSGTHQHPERVTEANNTVAPKHKRPKPSTIGETENTVVEVVLPRKQKRKTQETAQTPESTTIEQAQTGSSKPTDDPPQPSKPIKRKAKGKDDTSAEGAAKSTKSTDVQVTSTSAARQPDGTSSSHESASTSKVMTDAEFTAYFQSFVPLSLRGASSEVNPVPVASSSKSNPLAQQPTEVVSSLQPQPSGTSAPKRASRKRKNAGDNAVVSQPNLTPSLVISESDPPRKKRKPGDAESSAPPKSVGKSAAKPSKTKKPVASTSTTVDTGKETSSPAALPEALSVIQKMKRKKVQMSASGSQSKSTERLTNDATTSVSEPIALQASSSDKSSDGTRPRATVPSSSLTKGKPSSEKPPLALELAHSKSTERGSSTGISNRSQSHAHGRDLSASEGRVRSPSVVSTSGLGGAVSVPNGTVPKDASKANGRSNSKAARTSEKHSVRLDDDGGARMPLSNETEAGLAASLESAIHHNSEELARVEERVEKRKRQQSASTSFNGENRGSTPSTSSKASFHARLPISEVQVETQDEGSSNDSEDDSDDSDDSEDTDNDDKKMAPPQPTLPRQVIPDESLATDILGILSQPSQRSVLDEIPSSSEEEDEDKDGAEELELDEEEDFSRQVRRRKERTLRRGKSSSEERPAEPDEDEEEMDNMFAFESPHSSAVFQTELAELADGVHAEGGSTGRDEVERSKLNGGVPHDRPMADALEEHERADVSPGTPHEEVMVRGTHEPAPSTTPQITSSFAPRITSPHAPTQAPPSPSNEETDDDETHLDPQQNAYAPISHLPVPKKAAFFESDHPMSDIEEDIVQPQRDDIEPNSREDGGHVIAPDSDPIEPPSTQPTSTQERAKVRNKHAQTIAGKVERMRKGSAVLSTAPVNPAVNAASAFHSTINPVTPAQLLQTRRKSIAQLPSWLTLSTGSAHTIVSDSPAVDELRSSSPHVPDPTPVPANGKAKRAKKTLNTQTPKRPREPLFYPSSSHAPATQERPREVSDSEEERRLIRNRRQRPRASQTPFKALSLMESQDMFSQPSTPVLGPPAQGARKKADFFGRDQSSSSSSSSSSEESDTQAKKAPLIPKDRRAGVKKGKGKGQNRR